MKQTPDTPSAFIKTLAMDLSFWILLFSHLSVIGLVWFEGWHPLTLLWIYISQQIVQTLLDILLLLYNPKLDITGFEIGGKPATDSKKDRKNCAGMLTIIALMLGGISFAFFKSDMGMPAHTFPLICATTVIFAFQKLFSYFYLRYMDGPQVMNMGCLVMSPVIILFLLFFLFFFGNFLYLFFESKDPLSILNLTFLGVFILVKLLYDFMYFLFYKYGSSSNTQISISSDKTPKV